MKIKLRIIAFKSIFANLFSENDVFEVAKELLIEEKEENLNEVNKSFLDTILNNFVEHKVEIKTLLDEKIEGYELERIYKVDLALIYLGAVEILYVKTDKPLVINEMLTIAKVFSVEKSSSFINGVLAKI